MNYVLLSYTLGLLSVLAIRIYYLLSPRILPLDYISIGIFIIIYKKNNSLI